MVKCAVLVSGILDGWREGGDRVGLRVSGCDSGVFLLGSTDSMIIFTKMLEYYYYYNII